MAGTVVWEGRADAVAQVTTVTVGGTLSGETFTISVGGVAIATHTDADTVIATTVAALVAACPLLERSAVKASSAPRSNGRKFQHTASATNRPFVTLGGKNHGARFI